MFVGVFCRASFGSELGLTTRVPVSISAEKLYQVEHPRLVSQFDDVVAPESDDKAGYYISKGWLKGDGGSRSVVPQY